MEDENVRFAWTDGGVYMMFGFRFQESSLDKPCNELVLGSTLWQQDMHMPHYGKSGYRWIPYDKFGVARRVVNDEARDAKELPVVKVNVLSCC